MSKGADLLSKFVTYSKYASYLPDLKRRQNWGEIVGTLENMHMEKFPQLTDSINEAFDAVRNKEIMPSMRSLQFGGAAILKQPMRSYNCSFTHLSKVKDFVDVVYALLCGCGVGFSVQQRHIRHLPKVKGVYKGGKQAYVIADSIEGWALAFGKLLESYFLGEHEVEFNYSQIRPEGARISIGGKSPGPGVLKIALDNVKKVLETRVNNRLRSIDVHDMICHATDAVYSGGIRRSALISLFDNDDLEMLNCKSGEWWVDNPQRARANNSALFHRDSPRELFDNSWKATTDSRSGEPGYIFTSNFDMGYNPCCFVGETKLLTEQGYRKLSSLVGKKDLNLVNHLGETHKGLVWSSGTKPIVELRTSLGDTFKCTPDHVFMLDDGTGCQAQDSLHKNLKITGAGSPTVTSITVCKDEEVFDFSIDDETHWGVVRGGSSTVGYVVHNCEISLHSHQLCNLTTINAASCFTEEEFHRRARLASFIGTLQASYTNFPFISPKWRETTEREALIGVSITGIGSGLICNYDLTRGAEVVKAENERVANLIGINPAARTTCTKPEGCQKPDTLVTTEDGIFELQELGDSGGDRWQDTKVNVLTDDGLEFSDKFFVNGFAKTKAITLSSHMTLECTHNHMYRVITDEGNYVWKRSDELQVGDHIPYRVGGYVGPKNQVKLKPVKAKPKNKHATQYKYLNLPKTIDEQFAWFLGLYWGDGSNHKSGIRVSGDKRKLDNLCKAAHIMQKKFNIKFSYFEHKGEDNRCQIYFNSQMLLDFMETNNLLKPRSKDLEVPLWIRRSPKEVMQSFFDGYCAADGYKDESRENYCTVSKKMAEQTVTCLRALGKDCTIYIQKPTETSYGTNNKYIVSVLRGRSSDLGNQRLDTRKVWEHLDKHGLSNCNFDTITEIVDSECLTLDISVPSNNTYLANSYVSHNSSSCVLKSSSGVHAWHDKYYIRTMRFSKHEDIAQYLMEVMPEFVEDDLFNPKGIVVSLPIEAPDEGYFRQEPTRTLLERVRKYNLEWVAPGHRSGDNINNVSATISVRDNEWQEVGDWMWNNRHTYSGISVLPYDNGTYQQAPFQTIDKETYEELTEKLPEVNLDDIYEDDDNTSLAQSVACAGGVCEII